MSPSVPSAAAADAAPALRAAVLAGGASGRMGRPKAAVELAGRPLISYPLAAARLAGLAPFVVARADSELPETPAPAIIEPAGPRHALSGIVAALEHAGEPIVVLACDLPFVPAELITELARRRAALALPGGPRLQPLVARYAPGLLPRLRAGLRSGEPLVEVALGLGGDRLTAAELRTFGDPERIFTNVNSPEDLARAEEALRGLR